MKNFFLKVSALFILFFAVHFAIPASYSFAFTPKDITPYVKNVANVYTSLPGAFVENTEANAIVAHKVSASVVGSAQGLFDSAAKIKDTLDLGSYVQNTANVYTSMPGAFVENIEADANVAHAAGANIIDAIIGWWNWLFKTKTTVVNVSPSPTPTPRPTATPKAIPTPLPTPTAKAPQQITNSPVYQTINQNIIGGVSQGELTRRLSELEAIFNLKLQNLPQAIVTSGGLTMEQLDQLQRNIGLAGQSAPSPGSTIYYPTLTNPNVTGNLSASGDISANSFFGDGSHLTGISGGGGSGNSAFTIGSGVIYNATSTDKVGIGTTTPANTLSVSGTTGVSIFNPTNYGDGLVISGGQAAGGSPVLRIENSTGAAFSWGVQGNSNVGFAPNGLQLYNYALGQPSLVITAANNFSFGGYNSLSKVGISGNASVGSSYYTLAAPADGMIVEGTVGIGTTTPGYKLTVGGDINFTGNLYQNGSLFSSGGGSGNSAFTIGSGKIFNATSTDLVGIGTSSPTATLTVQGKPGTNPFIISSSTGTTMLSLAQNGDLVTAGRVGIGGVGIPLGSLLSVSGTGAVPGFSLTNSNTSTSSANAVSFLQSNSISGGAFATVSHQLIDASRLGFITSSGNLVTTAPLAKFSDNCVVLSGTCVSSADILQITQDYTSNSGAALNVSTAGTGFALRVNDDGTFTDSTPFVITALGDVGIGTTTPFERLTVAGNGFFSGTLTVATTTATSTIAGGFSVNNGSITSDWSTGVTSIDSLELGSLSFAADSGKISWVDLPVTASSTVGKVQSYSAQIDSNPVLTVYGESDGVGGARYLKVGIGTTSPLSTLSVYGDIHLEGTSRYLNFGGTATGTNGYGFRDSAGTMQFKNSGGNWTSFSSLSAFTVGNGFIYNSTTTDRVVIGTTTPFAKLSIQNSFGATVPLLDISSTTSALFATSSVFRIQANGNIGIGSSTPLSTLSISGRAGVNPFTIASSTGAQMFTVTQAGNVGIAGTPAANERFLVNGDSNFNGVTVHGSTAYFGNTTTVISAAGNIDIGGSSLLNIDGSGYFGGNIGIGTTTPFERLTVAGNGYFTGTLTSATTTATSTIAGGLSVGGGAITHNWASGVTSIASLELGAFNFDNDAGIVSWTDLPITTASASGTVHSYSAQIDSNPVLTIFGQANASGAAVNLRVGIGTTTPGYTLHVVGDDGAGNVAKFQTGAGATSCTLNGTTGLLNCSSDERLKNNIETLDTDVFDKVMALNPVSYNWKTDNASSSKKFGFIAQEVEGIFPELVVTDTETGYKQLSLTGFVPFMVKAMQEIYHKLEKVAAWFSPNGDKLKIQGEVCVDDVCVTKSQFKALLQQGGGSSNGGGGGGGDISGPSPEPTGSPTPTPEESGEPEPTPEPDLTGSPQVTPTPEPTATPEPTE